jgi:hypothetical protein
LVGQHAQVACAQCHVNGVLKGTPQVCVDCHRKDDVHKGLLGSDCARCHSSADWKQVKFDHSQSAFKLIGKHIQVTCTQCHTNRVFKSTPQTCIECHRKDDKHKSALGTDCAKCHSPEDWKQVKFDHNLSAFKLVGKHVPVACDKCHVNSVLKGTPQACVDCHRKDDKHQGAYGTNCGQCHTPEDWKKAKFDHNLSVFKLTGAHVNVTCAKCHVNNVFKGTPQTCVACHPEPQVHRGQFGADCVQCHTTTTWKGATFKHTFPLDHGERGRIACATCHTLAGNFKAYTCYGCHEHDPASIARKHSEERVSNIEDCVRCHPTGRGKDGQGGD